MKKVGFLIFCLFAMCSMAGKAQDVVADSTGYIVKVGEDGSRFYSEADGWEKHYPFGTSWEGGHVAVYRELVWGMP